jgi:lipoprotein NlpD
VTARRRRLFLGAAAGILCVCSSLLAACTSVTTSLPAATRREARAAVHVVQRGETLYKIAWQYRVDMQDLAVWNGITNPDVLRVGQRLRLVPPRGYVAAGAAPAPQARPGAAPREQPTAAASRDRATAAPAPRAAPPPPRPATASTPAALTWSWPTEGRVETPFGAPGGISSGIGIGGREGQPVRAAAAGRVVYAGGGLIGYGQLVIIKHDETFLSAYGHNSELLVTQGQEVQRGQTIALMGFGPGRRPRLHFEIRRDGVPVDPLLFVGAPR